MLPGYWWHQNQYCGEVSMFPEVFPWNLHNLLLMHYHPLVWLITVSFLQWVIKHPGCLPFHCKVRKAGYETDPDFDNQQARY